MTQDQIDEIKEAHDKIYDALTDLQRIASYRADDDQHDTENEKKLFAAIDLSKMNLDGALQMLLTALVPYL